MGGLSRKSHDIMLDPLLKTLISITTAVGIVHVLLSPINYTAMVSNR